VDRHHPMERLQLQAGGRPVRHAAGRGDLARQTSAPGPHPHPPGPPGSLPAADAESPEIGLLPCRTDIFAVDQTLCHAPADAVEQRGPPFTGMGQPGRRLPARAGGRELASGSISSASELITRCIARCGTVRPGPAIGSGSAGPLPVAADSPYRRKITLASGVLRKLPPLDDDSGEEIAAPAAAVI
jgi:hypothetical protein